MITLSIPPLTIGNVFVLIIILFFMLFLWNLTFSDPYKPSFKEKPLEGLALRDYFASKALIECSGSVPEDIKTFPVVARHCYDIADAMMAERKIRIEKDRNARE